MQKLDFKHLSDSKLLSDAKTPIEIVRLCNRFTTAAAAMKEMAKRLKLPVSQQPSERDYLTACEEQAVATSALRTKFMTLVSELDAANVTMILKVFRHAGQQLHLGDAIAAAARQNNISAVRMLIKEGSADWNHGICGAAEGGHVSMIGFFMSKGATTINLALQRAAEAGHYAAVEDLIQRGAIGFDMAFTAATEIAIIKLLHNSGATNFNGALDGAVIRGNMTIASYLIDAGATNKDAAIASARQRGDRAMENLLLSKAWPYVVPAPVLVPEPAIAPVSPLASAPAPITSPA